MRFSPCARNRCLSVPIKGYCLISGWADICTGWKLQPSRNPWQVTLGPHICLGMLIFLWRVQLQNTAGCCQYSQGCLQQSWYVLGTELPSHCLGGASMGQPSTSGGLQDLQVWLMLCETEHPSAGDKNAAQERGTWHQPLEVLQDDLHHGGGGVDRSGEHPPDSRSWQQGTGLLVVSGIAAHECTCHQEPSIQLDLGQAQGHLGCHHHQPWPNSARRHGPALCCPGFCYFQLHLSPNHSSRLRMDLRSPLELYFQTIHLQATYPGPPRVAAVWGWPVLNHTLSLLSPQSPPSWTGPNLTWCFLQTSRVSTDMFTLLRFSLAQRFSKAIADVVREQKVGKRAPLLIPTCTPRHRALPLAQTQPGLATSTLSHLHPSCLLLPRAPQRQGGAQAHHKSRCLFPQKQMPASADPLSLR